MSSHLISIQQLQAALQRIQVAHKYGNKQPNNNKQTDYNRVIYLA